MQPKQQHNVCQFIAVYLFAVFGHGQTNGHVQPNLGDLKHVIAVAKQGSAFRPGVCLQFYPICFRGNRSANLRHVIQLKVMAMHHTAKSSERNWFFHPE